MRLLTVFFLSLTLIPNLVHATAKVDPVLAKFARGESSTQHVRIIALLNPPADGDTAPEKYHYKDVISYLRSRARKSLKAVFIYLKEQDAYKTTVMPTHFYSVSNAFSADVTPQGLKTLAEAPGVKKIYANHKIFNEKGQRRHRFVDQTPSKNQLAYDFKETGLDQLIKEKPSITGEGVILGQIDTGVDGDHPALAGKILKFYDDEIKKIGKPHDIDSHGTHTAGTMVGGNRTNLVIGVAPGAKLISAGALESLDAELRGMEFMLDPDGDPSTRDYPRVVNNSWNSIEAPDQEPFYRAISAWEAAGILPVFSAGNSGEKGEQSITPPHEHPAVLAVGNFGPGGKIANSSSRGPGMFKGQPTQKPDLAAPGEGIYSCVPNGEFESMDGTSMATPHVTGTVGLMLQVNPSLTPPQIRQILIHTVSPKNKDGTAGTAGNWNSAYGFGNLDSYKAVRKASALASQALGSFGLSDGLLQSPESIEDKAIQELDPGKVDLDDYTEENPSGWLTAKQIWR